MLKKRILSLFVAMTLVLTTSLPSVTFATDNEAQLEEVVEEVSEEEVDEETIHCVECNSENVSLLISLFNLYHCEDCGKYFTVGSSTNKKSISDQVSAVEEDAKKEAEKIIFGTPGGIGHKYHFYFNDAVLFDANDADAIFQKVPDYREVAWGNELPENIEHYDFLGWAKSVGFAKNKKVTVAVDANFGSVKELYTVFDVKKYTINVYENYSSDDEVLIDNASIIYDEPYEYTKGTPEREGYKFLGWSEDRDAAVGDVENLDIESVDRDVDYYAIWIQEFGMKYPGCDVEKVDKGSDVVLRDTFDAKEGYTLEGWSETENSTEVEYELGATIENIERPYTLYPVYLPIDCDITVGADTETVKYDSEYTLPETFEDKEGYTFVGFTATGENYKEKYDKGESFTVKGSVSFSPIYEANTVEVSFMTNGEVYKTVDAKYDAKLEKPEDPVVEHYTFDGWFADETCETPYDFNEVIKSTEGFNVYAKLDIDKFDITFDTDGGNTIEKVTLPYGEKVEKPIDPEKEGHTFSKWTLDGADYVFDAIVEKSITLKAVYTVNKYEIKVGDNDPVEVEYGTEYTLPETYEINNIEKKFDGFKDQDNKTYEPGETFTVPAKAMTFEVLTKDKNKYTVKFFDGKTEYIGKRLTDVIEGTTVEAPTVTKYGYNFVNWYEDATFTKEFKFTDTITKETKVYAKFEEKLVLVKIDGNEQYVKFGSEVTLPEATVGDKQVFLDYEVTNSTEKYQPNEKITIDKEDDYEIKTNARDKYKYEVHFYDGDVEYDELALLEVYEGETIELPTVNKDKHTFKGWFTEKACTNKFDNANTIEKTMNLYAKFETNTVTVTFKIDGSEYDKKEISYSTAVTKPNPSKTGYTLSVWKLNGSDYKFTTLVKEDITLTASWIANTYTIKYDAQKGTVKTASFTKTYETNYTTLAIPTRAGYTFGGWYKESGCNNKYDGKSDLSTAKDATVTIYAKWTANTYIIEYNAQGGSVSPASFTKTYGTNVTLVTPTRAGYTFGGWYKESGCNNKYDGKSDLSTAKDATVTIYAKWEENSYSITYDLNGGSWSGSAGKGSRKYTESYTLPTNLTRLGYKFAGWESNDSMITKLSANNTNTYTLTAIWKKTYTVTVRYYNNVIGDETLHVKKFDNILEGTSFTPELDDCFLPRDTSLWGNASGAASYIAGYDDFSQYSMDDYSGLLINNNKYYYQWMMPALGVSIKYGTTFVVNSDMEIFPIAQYYN